VLSQRALAGTLRQAVIEIIYALFLFFPAECAALSQRGVGGRLCGKYE